VSAAPTLLSAFFGKDMLQLVQLSAAQPAGLPRLSVLRHCNGEARENSSRIGDGGLKGRLHGRKPCSARSPVCDAAASQRIKGGAGELHFGEVFIPFMGRRPMRTGKIACHTSELLVLFLAGYSARR
jgi:hypothetical protein